MRRLLVIPVLFLLCFSIALGQSPCESAYMPFKEGVLFVLSSYNAKGKLQSTISHEIVSVKPLNDGYQATAKTKVQDDKGKSTIDGEYTLDCTGDAIVLDVSSMFNPQMMESLKSMEVDISGTGLVVPNSLSVGQTLPDASMVIKASMNGMTLITMNMHITDRKVTGKEKITTPAGTFDCMKLEQVTTVDGMGKTTTSSASWFARGVGMVRSENYDKKGELDTETVLTEFKD